MKTWHWVAAGVGVVALGAGVFYWADTRNRVALQTGVWNVLPANVNQNRPDDGIRLIQQELNTWSSGLMVNGRYDATTQGAISDWMRRHPGRVATLDAFYAMAQNDLAGLLAIMRATPRS